MKKIVLFTIFFLSISLIAYSQSVNDLDARNGYKDFKIGDSFEKYKGKLIFRDYWKNDQNTPTYSVKQEFSYSDLFGYTIKAITLTFKANKLIRIDIFLKELVPVGVNMVFNADDFTNVTNKFKSLFGDQNYHVYNDDSYFISIMQWKGKKVELWVQFFYKGNGEGKDHIRVSVFDTTLINRSDSGF